MKFAVFQLTTLPIDPEAMPVHEFLEAGIFPPLNVTHLVVARHIKRGLLSFFHVGKAHGITLLET